jgi:hypothetical protein
MRRRDVTAEEYDGEFREGAEKRPNLAASILGSVAAGR